MQQRRAAGAHGIPVYLAGARVFRSDTSDNCFLALLARSPNSESQSDAPPNAASSSSDYLLDLVNAVDAVVAGSYGFQPYFRPPCPHVSIAKWRAGDEKPTAANNGATDAGGELQQTGDAESEECLKDAATAALPSRSSSRIADTYSGDVATDTAGGDLSSLLLEPDFIIQPLYQAVSDGTDVPVPSNAISTFATHVIMQCGADVFRVPLFP
jgi:hypothetical protein